jgi:hypothetical protein
MDAHHEGRLGSAVTAATHYSDVKACESHDTGFGTGVQKMASNEAAARDTIQTLAAYV